MLFKYQGTPYVRAYRKVWVPKTVDAEGHVIRRGHSVSAEQYQVGRFDRETSRVTVSSKFLYKFPQFSDDDWVYLKEAHDLPDIDSYREQLKSESVPSSETSAALGASIGKNAGRHEESIAADEAVSYSLHIPENLYQKRLERHLR